MRDEFLAIARPLPVAAAGVEGKLGAMRDPKIACSVPNADGDHREQDRRPDFVTAHPAARFSCQDATKSEL
jgi:hypothetical protein